MNEVVNDNKKKIIDDLIKERYKKISTGAEKRKFVETENNKGFTDEEDGENSSETNNNDDDRESFEKYRKEFERLAVNIELTDKYRMNPFYDVIGQDDVKILFKQVMVLPFTQKNISEFIGTYKGVLLYGPPGTGKTLLARAAALLVKSETEKKNKEDAKYIRYFNIKASDVLSSYKGISERKIFSLFQILRAAYVDGKPLSPEEQKKYFTVVFIDEIDSLLKDRDSDKKSDNEDVVNQFLGELDGVEPSGQGKLFLIGATNRPWSIDSAALRRLELRQYVELPNESDRKKVIDFYIEERRLKITNGPERVSKRLKSSQKSIDITRETNTMVSEQRILMDTVSNSFFGSRDGMSLYKYIGLFSSSDIRTLVNKILRFRINMGYKYYWIKKNGSWKMSNYSINDTDTSIVIQENLKQIFELENDILTPLSFKPDDNEKKDWYESIYKLIKSTKYTTRKNDLMRLLWYRIRETKEPSIQYDNFGNETDIKTLLKGELSDSSIYSIIDKIFQKFIVKPWILEEKMELIYSLFTNNGPYMGEIKKMDTKIKDSSRIIEEKLELIYNEDKSIFSKNK